MIPNDCGSCALMNIIRRGFQWRADGGRRGRVASSGTPEGAAFGRMKKEEKGRKTKKAKKDKKRETINAYRPS